MHAGYAIRAPNCRMRNWRLIGVTTGRCICSIRNFNTGNLIVSKAAAAVINIWRPFNHACITKHSVCYCHSLQIMIPYRHVASLHIFPRRARIVWINFNSIQFVLQGGLTSCSVTSRAQPSGPPRWATCCVIKSPSAVFSACRLETVSTRAPGNTVPVSSPSCGRC